MTWNLQGVTAPPDTAPSAPLDERYAVPCPTATSDPPILNQLIADLKLNPRTQLPPWVEGGCDPAATLSPREVLAGTATDEPDMGMDQNLDESADPLNERKFMGGLEGVTSQGFRHMYFGGWKLTFPIRTFQIPTHPIGQAAERTQAIAVKARELLQNGQPLWGYRLLGWAMHFVQDLAQPFHSVQIPHLGMVPWATLWSWPPEKAFGELVKQTTRTISNYHFAYEGYVLHQIKLGEESPFAECVSNAREHSKLQFDPSHQSPRELALQVSKGSIRIAPEMGRGVIGLFGNRLKKPQYDLPKNQGTVRYADLAIDPTLDKERKRLHRVTCEALANGAMASRYLLDWALR